MRVKDQASRAYLASGAATYQVKTGHGILRRIVFNKPVASSTVKVIDNTEGTTATWTITNTTDVKPYVLEYNCMMHLGIRLVLSGADDIVVVYD